jgi:hypothetical protein
VAKALGMTSAVGVPSGDKQWGDAPVLLLCMGGRPAGEVEGGTKAWLGGQQGGPYCVCAAACLAKSALCCSLAAACWHCQATKKCSLLAAMQCAADDPHTAPPRFFCVTPMRPSCRLMSW